MKNRHNLIHKVMLAAILTGGLQGVAQAEDLQTEQQPVRDEQIFSIGLGAFLGAVVGGPPGFIIGMIGMSAVDNYQYDKEQQLARLAEDGEQVAVATQENQQQAVELATFEPDRTTDMQVASLSNNAADRDQNQLVQALTTHFEQWVQFRTAQAELEPHLHKQLVQAASWMSQIPSVRIELHGYTDPRGPDQDNMALSRARLDSVRRALIAGGIDAKRITGYAHGESLPLYNADDIESNNFERRVLISFQVMEAKS
ncbi:MAG TPA: hypothetical protein ENI64_00890 [Gammaproteobacteria bacterium]|nr:hypothetical protein [Gammaproteobacteria bacterium]